MTIHQTSRPRLRLSPAHLVLIAFTLAACDEADADCGPGEVRLPTGCAPECEAGQEHVDGVCRDVCADDEQRALGDCVTDFEITPMGVRLDSVGFVPDRAKLASIPVTSLDVDLGFVVRAAGDDSEVFSGTGELPLTDRDSGELVWVADFTELAETGEYYVEANGTRSPVFSIAPDVHRETLRTMMLGLYGQRCGTAVSFEFAGWPFEHEACHLDDGSLEFVDGSSDIQTATHGWHDAGDYGKYVVNGAFALGMLLKAWEHFQPRLESLNLDIPEHGGPLPDFLAEAKWQLDWLLGMQFADGSVAHKLSPVSFAQMVMPGRDGRERFLSGAGTTATADFAAVTAQAARIYEPYDALLAQTLLAAARAAWAYLLDHPSYEAADMSDFTDQQYQGGYSGDDDDRFWAAAELWETTGEAEYLTEAENNAGWMSVRLDWDWNNQGNLGTFTYALSEREGRDATLVSMIESDITYVADEIAQNAGASRYGRGLNAGSFNWGTNGSVARIAMNLYAAYRISSEAAYLDAIGAQVDHLLGRNFYGRSMVTGIGHYPPQAPHHRPSASDGVAPPWPGLLVGGPNGQVDWWEDVYESYRSNEVAINWLTPLVYALAALEG